MLEGCISHLYRVYLSTTVHSSIRRVSDRDRASCSYALCTCSHEEVAKEAQERIYTHSTAVVGKAPVIATSRVDHGVSVPDSFAFVCVCWFLGGVPVSKPHCDNGLSLGGSCAGAYYVLSVPLCRAPTDHLIQMEMRMTVPQGAFSGSWLHSAYECRLTNWKRTLNWTMRKLLGSLKENWQPCKRWHGRFIVPRRCAKCSTPCPCCYAAFPCLSITIK